MTKDLFNTQPESIKTSEQHVSLFLSFYFPVCDFYPGFKLLCVFPTNRSATGWRSKVKMADSQCVIRISPLPTTWIMTDRCCCCRSADKKKEGTKTKYTFFIFALDNCKIKRFFKITIIIIIILVLVLATSYSDQKLNSLINQMRAKWSIQTQK